MGKIVVVPNALRDAALRLVDDVLPGDANSHDRDAAYASLLAYYDVHGRLPDRSQLTVTKFVPPNTSEDNRE